MLMLIMRTLLQCSICVYSVLCMLILIMRTLLQCSICVYSVLCMLIVYVVRTLLQYSMYVVMMTVLASSVFAKTVDEYPTTTSYSLASVSMYSPTVSSALLYIGEETQPWWRGPPGIMPGIRVSYTIFSTLSHTNTCNIVSRYNTLLYIKHTSC